MKQFEFRLKTVLLTAACLLAVALCSWIEGAKMESNDDLASIINNWQQNPIKEIVKAPSNVDCNSIGMTRLVPENSDKYCNCALNPFLPDSFQGQCSLVKNVLGCFQGKDKNSKGNQNFCVLRGALTFLDANTTPSGCQEGKSCGVDSFDFNLCFNEKADCPTGTRQTKVAAKIEDYTTDIVKNSNLVVDLFLKTDSPPPTGLFKLKQVTRSTFQSSKEAKRKETFEFRTYVHFKKECKHLIYSLFSLKETNSDDVISLFIFCSLATVAAALWSSFAAPNKQIYFKSLVLTLIAVSFFTFILNLLFIESKNTLFTSLTGKECGEEPTNSLLKELGLTYNALKVINGAQILLNFTVFIIIQYPFLL